jgi:hypothetical protein
MMFPFPTNHPTWIAGVYLLKLTNRDADFKQHCTHYGDTWRPVQQVHNLSARNRPAVSFREFTVRILCILLSSILLNNTEERFKNMVKKYTNYISGLWMM